MKKSNEQLIKELEEKLYRYTFEMDESEVDPAEVEAICNLLDVLDPKEDNFTDVKTSYKKFRKMCQEDDKQEKSKKKIHYKRILPFAAAIVILFLTINVGSYATKGKSFFEVMSKDETGMEIHVGGDTEFDGMKESDMEYFSSWEEVDEDIRKEIIELKEMPEGFELEEITVRLVESKRVVTVKYKSGEKYFDVRIEVYNDSVINRKTGREEGWNLVKEVSLSGVALQYYQRSEEIKLEFWDNNCFYRMVGNLKMDEFEKMIETIV